MARRRHDSIRGTLLGWYGVILTGVLLVFGALLYRSAARTVLQAHDALIESRAAALVASVEWDASDGWEMELAADYLRALAETTHFAVWDGQGKLLRAAGLPDPAGPPPESGLRQRGTLRERIVRGSNGVTALVGVSLAAEGARLRGLLFTMIAGGVGVLALALAGGWWLANRTMAPIARMSQQAAGLQASDLSVRLDSRAVPRELLGLCATLNETFARLEEAFARQTRFTADASHELRTPLSIIRAQLEVALSRPRGADEYRDTLATCLVSAERMTAIVEGLLTLARSDAGAERLVRERVRLDGVIRAVADSLRPAARQRGIALRLTLDEVEVWGDGHRLADVASNLLSNAIRYNRDGGGVDIAVGREGEQVKLQVADTGIGIPAELRGKVFERFFRADAARARAAGGAGLGLAITHRIVEAHGGLIRVHDNPGGGTVFIVLLPARKLT